MRIVEIETEVAFDRNAIVVVTTRIQDKAQGDGHQTDRTEMVIK